MTLRGTVKKGKVVLAKPTKLPDGTAVEIRVVPKKKQPAKKKTRKAPPRTLYERLKPFIGIIKDMPPDSSVNLDHYFYGAPKQQP